MDGEVTGHPYGNVTGDVKEYVKSFNLPLTANHVEITFYKLDIGNEPYDENASNRQEVTAFNHIAVCNGEQELFSASNMNLISPRTIQITRGIQSAEEPLLFILTTGLPPAKSDPFYHAHFHGKFFLFRDSLKQV